MIPENLIIVRRLVRNTFLRVVIICPTDGKYNHLLFLKNIL